MGSFNTTCFASQQTITPHAECLIFPISQQSSYNPVEISLDNEIYQPFGITNSTCYPSAFWKFSGPIIKGTYDDYGRFNLTNSSKNQQNIVNFFNQLHQKLFQVNQGENTSHDLPLNFQQLYHPEQTYKFDELVSIWDKLWDVGQEHRLFISNTQGNPSQLDFAIMHQHTADYLIQLTCQTKNYDNQSFEKKGYFTHYIQSKLDINSVTNTTQNIFSLPEISRFDNYYIGQFEGSNKTNFYQLYPNFKEIIANYRKTNLNNHLQLTSVPQKLIASLYEISQEQLDHLYIYEALNNLNIKLSPMVYATEDYQNEMGDSYTKMVKSVNEAIKLDIKDQYGEDDENKNDDQFNDNQTFNNDNESINNISDNHHSEKPENITNRKNEPTYAIASLDFLGNDDFNFKSTSVRQVTSIDEWKQQIQQQLEEEFQQSGEINISHSDNNGTPFTSVDSVMQKISFKEINKSAFEQIVTNIGENFGNHAYFMGYTPPVIKPTKKLKAKK